MAHVVLQKRDRFFLFLSSGAMEKWMAISVPYLHPEAKR